jgi:DNA (cytosine-5)-methyltransferase 1
MTMKHGSLFSGIGGFDLAAEWMGWENVFHCEWNPFGQKVLKHYWPNSISYNDITKTDFTIHRRAIDILTGGFPCQPYSSAGKRLGKEDERHLWPSMLRAIREIQPRWIVGENVLGLVNWNGGMVFEEVQADLEAEGYEVQPYVLPAAAVNAPHRRDRVWFVAYADSNSRRATKGNINEERQHIQRGTSRFGVQRIASNTESKRYQHKHTGYEKFSAQTGSGLHGRSSFEYGQCGNWDNFPTVSPIHTRNDGFSNRLDGITFSKWRNESIKAAGNAIVPQVVFQIFKAIHIFETQNLKP